MSGVTTSGIEAAKSILKCRSRDILTGTGPGPLFLQAEDTSLWPEHLKRKIERGGEPARPQDEVET